MSKGSLLAGVAGEYFVAAELSRRGYVASITLRNTKGIDVLASNADATRMVGIQVKTSQGSDAKWMLNKKAEETPDGDLAENLFYVFVNLNGRDEPTYYVVPRREVAKFIKIGHQVWLAQPGRGARAHQDHPMRQFRIPRDKPEMREKYRSRWDLLRLDGTATAVGDNGVAAAT